MSVAQRKVRRNNESNRREELLRVSARLFREKGFDGTTIRDISGAAGMHSGSPFYHFKTKQDILVAVMEQGLAEGLRSLEAAMAGGANAEQRFLRMIRAQIGTILEDGNDFIPVLLYDWRSLTAANRRRIVALKDRYDALWQQVIDELQARRPHAGRRAAGAPAHPRRGELDRHVVSHRRPPLARRDRRGRGEVVPGHSLAVTGASRACGEPRRATARLCPITFEAPRLKRPGSRSG